MPFCDRCGREVGADENFCPSCGRKLRGISDGHQPYSAGTSMPRDQYDTGGRIQEAPRYAALPTRSPGIAALLALLLGLFGIFGIGHIYVGKIARGLVLLVAGILVVPVFLAIGVLGIISLDGNFMHGGFVLMILSGAIWFILLIWQTFDAYRLANEFNMHLQRTGTPPW